MNTAPVRVMVVDDHPMVRKGLSTVVSALPDFELVAAVATGCDAITAAAVHHPEVVVMDLRMPEMDGVQATRHLLEANPNVAVLVLTMHDDAALLRAALDAGARGYLLKGVTHTELVEALRAAVSSRAASSGEP